MANRPDPSFDVEQLRREVDRLRNELAAAGRSAARGDEARAAERHSHAGKLAAGEARITAAKVDARAAWARAAELGNSLGRRIAEGQARLIASQAAVASLERANEGLAAGQAVIALRESDLRAIIESAIDCAIVTTDQDGLVLAWNSGARRLLGWSEAGVVAMDLHAVLPPEDQERGVLAGDVAAALSGSHLSREGWLLRHDGSRVWAAVEAMPLHADGADAPIAVLWMLRDRSAAQRNEVALRESETRHRFLIENWTQAVWEADADGVVVADSPSWRAYTGQTPKEWLGYGWLNAIHPDDRVFAERQWREAIAARELVNAEFRLRAPDGGWRWTSVRAAPVIDAAGRVEKWVGMNIDIDARSRAEAALRESEERFRGFAENSADVLWITNRDGSRLDYLSPAFERTFGEPRDRILADLGRFRDLLHPDDRDAVAGLLPRALTGETPLTHYRVVRPSDGRVVHLRDTGFPIRDGTGAVARAGGIVQDITDLHAAATALEAEKERFRTLAEGIPQFVWRAGPDGGWTWASPQWLAYTGQAAEDSSGLGWLDAVHPDDREAARTAWTRAEELGIYETEFRLRHASSGTHAWFQARGAPLRAAGGSPVEWIGACADVDDQVRAREILARTGKELEVRVRERTAELMAAEETLRQSQKMEAIGQLTGGIAHDFNNMLQGVVGALDMSQRRLAEGRTSDVLRYIQAAGDAAIRAAGLTHRLLAFARRQRLDPRPIDVGALIGGMSDLLHRTLGPSTTLDLQLRHGPGQVLCDSSELESVVLNLCINARDAMLQGGRLTIAVKDVWLAAADIAEHEGVATGDYVSIRVEDTGMGMTPDILERVLEPFFTTKPQGEGTGLGLSQVHGFVRQSDGVLRITSVPGHGTKVLILLPLNPAAALLPDGDGSAQAVQRSRGETVLMVDDEAAVREPAAEHLRDLGYRVVEANDGPAALRLLNQGLQPDVLVTDVGMPNGMDGRVLTEEAQRRLPGLPVIFVTGYARVALPDDAVIITKPFDLDLLARRLSEVVPES